MNDSKGHLAASVFLVMLCPCAIARGAEAAPDARARRLATAAFEVVVGPRGLQRFAAVGFEDALLSAFHWRWLRREAEDQWPGTMQASERVELTQGDDGTITLLQTFADFDFRWRFMPVHDGLGLEIDCVAMARRDFRSGAGGAQVPQLGWSTRPESVVYSDGEAHVRRSLRVPKAMQVGADWVAIECGLDRPSLLLVALTDDWHGRVRVQLPDYLNSSDWPRDVHKGDEFRMRYHLVPFSGPVAMALERYLPRDEQPPIDLPRGFAFWSAHALAHVPLRAAESLERILAARDHDGIDVRLARGETEPFQVVFTPATGRRFDDVELAFTALRHADAEVTLPGTALRWRRARYLNLSEADVLEPPAPFTAGAGRDRNHPLWVDVSVPADAVAGEYEGFVLLRADGRDLARLPLRVHVWDFELPRRVPLRTALFGFWPNFLRDHYPAAKASDEVLHDMLRRGCDALAAHRIVHNNDTVGQVPWRPSVPRLLTPEGERELLEWCEFWSQRGLAIGEVRVYEPHFWEHYWPIFRSRGWADEVFSAHSDEYATLEGARKALRAAESLRSVAPGLKFMSTAIGAGLTVHEAADPATDIWSTTPHVFTALRSFFEGRRAAGESVWLYLHHHVHMTAGPAAARTFFWQLSRLGLDGCCLWGLNAWGKEPMSWSDDGLVQHKTYVGYPSGAGVLFWPGPDGMLESARLQRVRDGIEDWMMLSMVEQALEGARGRAASDTPWMKQARVALRLRDALVRDALIAGTEVFEHQRDPVVFEEIRAAVGDALAAAPRP